MEAAMEERVASECDVVIVTGDSIPAISYGPFKATALGLIVLDKSVGFGTWEAYGLGIQRVAGSVQWVIGDWLNFGESRYGEDYAQVLPETQRGYDSLSQCKWVAAAVDASTRVPELSWSHHREVASLSPDEQSHWLAIAIEFDYSVRQLADAIRGAGERNDPGPASDEDDGDVDPKEDWEWRALRAESHRGQCITVMQTAVQTLTAHPDDRDVVVNTAELLKGTVTAVTNGGQQFGGNVIDGALA